MKKLRPGEIFASNISDKGLISGIYIKNSYNLRVKSNLIRKQAKDINRHFTKEAILMVNKHMKRCSISLTIRELQIKSTRRYYYTSIRMATIF